MSAGGANTISFVVNSEIGTATRAFATIAQKVVDAGGSVKDFGKAVKQAGDEFERTGVIADKATKAWQAQLAKLSKEAANFTDVQKLQAAAMKEANAQFNEDKAEKARKYAMEMRQVAAEASKSQIAFEQGAAAGAKMNEAVGNQSRQMRIGTQEAGSFSSAISSLVMRIGGITAVAAGARAAIGSVFSIAEKAQQAAGGAVSGKQALLAAVGGDAKRFAAASGKADELGGSYGIPFEQSLKIQAAAEKSGIGGESDLLFQAQRFLGLDATSTADTIEKLRGSYGKGVTAQRVIGGALGTSKNLGGSVPEILESLETLGPEASSIGASPEELMASVGVLRQKTSNKRAVGAVRSLAETLRTQGKRRVDGAEAARLQAQGIEVTPDGYTGFYFVKDESAFTGRGFAGGAAEFQRVDPEGYKAFIAQNADVGALLGSQAEIAAARGNIDAAGRSYDNIGEIGNNLLRDPGFSGQLAIDKAKYQTERSQRPSAGLGVRTALQRERIEQEVSQGGALATAANAFQGIGSIFGFDFKGALAALYAIQNNTATGGELSSITNSGVGNKSGDYMP